MVPDFSAEDRYVRHQRGLFVTVLPRALTTTAVSPQPLAHGKMLLPAPAPQVVPHAQPAQLQDVQRDLHSVVRSLQRQVDELQDMVRSLQQPSTSEAVDRPSATVHEASPSTAAPIMARTPSEEALLQMYRQRRAEVEECRPEVPPSFRQRSKESAESLEAPVPSAQDSVPERRRQAPTRSWSLGTCRGPNLWQVLQHRLGLHPQDVQTNQLGRRPKLTASKERAAASAVPSSEEVTRNMSWREIADYIAEDLQTRYGCLEVAAATAAFALQMCTEHDINACLMQMGEGEKGLRSAPLSTVAGHLPSVSFGAQAFEDALLDVLQVRISRKCARRLFRLLAAVPRPSASISSGVGSSAELPQLAQPELWAVDEVQSSAGRVQKPVEVKAQTARRSGASVRAPTSRSPERRESKISAGRGRPAEAAPADPAPPALQRSPGGVHLQEHIRKHWQHGLRSDSADADRQSPQPAARKPSLLSQRSVSGSSLAPPRASGAAATMNKRDREAWRRELSLQSLLDFEAEVRARQEHPSSATSSDHEPQREPPASSPRPAAGEPFDSPPCSVRLRNVEDHHKVAQRESETRPATHVETQRQSPSSLEAIPATWQNRRRSI
ncbi:RFXANK [Symbiodinium natans]|uniref:RFXANK protein n=1 Tax=Symbiodinium natans TaxID=878477 RepID=A0A812QWD9_9DINO|nr:RFXANK [Symbiodinium natans]